MQGLSVLVRDEGAGVVASNQVIGEAYVAVQHHYGATRADARAGLLHVLRSGLVSPLNGTRVLDAIGSTGGAGLVDRLIADDYTREDLDVLTLDRAMASLPRVRILEAETA